MCGDLYCAAIWTAGAAGDKVYANKNEQSRLEACLEVEREGSSFDILLHAFSFQFSRQTHGSCVRASVCLRVSLCACVRVYLFKKLLRFSQSS